MGRLLILVAACSLAMAGNAISISPENDSIFIDNKWVRVDAQVQFNALSSVRAERGVVREPWDIHALELQYGFGLGGRDTDDRWHRWTGEFDRSWTVTMGFGPRRRPNRSAKSTVEVTGILGLCGMSILGLDASQLPDSLIGFIEAGPGAEPQMVTYERFSIGVETDTVPFQASRRTVFSPMLGGRMAFQDQHFGVFVDAGAMRIPKHAERLRFNPPSLTEPAFSLGEQRMVGWRPVLAWRIGANLPNSPWNVHAGGRIILGYQQNHWLGFGVGYMW